MNWTVEDYIEHYFGGTNHTWDRSDFYETFDAYNIESFQSWEGQVETLKKLNKAFTIVSIIFGVLDLLFLVTGFSASARERSASWYLYHLTFVTILHVTFSLPKLVDDLHSVFGTCMFFSFASWTLTLVYFVNLALMNIEILATIFASNPRWKPNPKKRFVISMTAMWISCILFSVILMFFGHDEHHHFPVCFNQNLTGRYMGLVVRDWIPALLVFAQTIAGLVLFIRAKISPENYRHLMENQHSLRSFNEWFAYYMTWNFLIILTDGMMFELFMMFFPQGIFVDITIQMVVFLVRSGLPLSCLLLEPVRETCMKWAIAGFQFVTGIKQNIQTRAPEMQSLDMEACE